MDLQEAMLKLKEKVTEYFKTDEPVKENFKDVKLQDGVTIVSYDGDVLSIGVPLYVMTPEGRLPAPDGDIVLEDGTAVSVKDGLVAEVGTPEEEKAPEETGAGTPSETPEMPMAESPVETKPKRVIKSQVEEHVFNAFVETSNAEIATLKAEVAELKANFNKSLEMNKEVFKIVEAIAEQPASAATENKKEVFNPKTFKAEFKADLRKYYK